MLGPSPFALVTPAFRFRSLALAAGRAPLGGAREAALAALIAARLAAAMLPPVALSIAARTARADAARGWLGSVALPAVPKLAITRLVEATAAGDRQTVANAVAKVTEVTAPYLDKAARLELEELTAELRG